MANYFYTVAKKTAWNHLHGTLSLSKIQQCIFSSITTNTHSESFQLIFFFRWEESITTFSHHSSINKCAILEMVEYLPECLKVSLYLASNVTFKKVKAGYPTPPKIKAVSSYFSIVM